MLNLDNEEDWRICIGSGGIGPIQSDRSLSSDAGVALNVTCALTSGSRMCTTEMNVFICCHLKG